MFLSETCSEVESRSVSYANHAKVAELNVVLNTPPWCPLDVYDPCVLNQDFGTGALVGVWVHLQTRLHLKTTRRSDYFNYACCNASKCIEGLKDWGKCKQYAGWYNRQHIVRQCFWSTASRPETERNQMSPNPFCWPTLASLYQPLHGSDIHQVRLAVLHSCSIVGSF